MDIKRYGKLVRDLVPWHINNNGNGECAVTHIADIGELWALSLQKLREEVGEFLQKPRDVRELADILAVVELLAQQLGCNWQQLLALKDRKEREKGGFRQRIVLDEVHSGTE